MSEIKVNIKDRVEWLSKRINLEGYQKDYITFQMKEAVREALEQVKNNDLLHSVSESSYAKKYAELREKCEDVVYSDPDGETDHCELIAEIVCDEFDIM